MTGLDKPYESYEYRVGGSLPADAPSYVTRQADHDFYAGLKAREYCYVLNSRQMGKSSLRVQTMRRLQAEGVACATIDLSAFSSQAASEDKWYAGVIWTLVSELGLSDRFHLRSWRQEHDDLLPVQQFGVFVETLLLAEIRQNIVIFVDEIDSILRYDFKDSFFAAIRAFYNKRADQSDYQRLTFALLGVATPSELIGDERHTPFNIGRAIELTGFQLAEAQPLARGLVGKVSDPLAVLQEILTWTGGQPFLTQKVCQLVVEALETHSSEQAYPPTPSISEWVTQQVRSQIIENWEAHDEPQHLKTIRDRILNREQRRSRLLGLYQKILQQGAIPAIDNPDQLELRFTGLVVRHEGMLQVYNPIYREVFNQQWIEQALSELRPYLEALAAWVDSGKKDTSRLLRGQALQEALTWKAGRSLSLQDEEFLDASQQEERRSTQQALEAEAEAKRIFERANQILEDANRKAKRRILLGSVISGLTLMGAIGSFLFARYWQSEASTAQEEVEDARKENNQLSQQVKQARQNLQRAGNKQKTAEDREKKANRNLQVAQKRLDAANQQVEVARVQVNQADRNRQEAELAEQQARSEQQQAEQIREQALNEKKQADEQAYLAREGTRLERAGIEALQRFDFEPAGALINAMRAGKDLNQLVQSYSVKGLEEYPAASPILALKTVLDKIWQPPIVFQGYSYNSKFSPDGQRILTTSSDTTVLWNLNGRKLAVIPQTGTVAEFSPNSQYILIASSNVAQVWSLNGKKLAILSHQDFVRSAQFSPDSQRIFTVSNDNTVREWSLDGRKLADLRENERVINIHFSPDGLRIVTASTTNTIQIWDATGKELAILQGHQDIITDVQFSSDGQRIVTASSDKTARIWNLNGQILATLQHQDIIGDVQFSPDGQRILTTSFDRSVRIWDLNGKELAVLPHNSRSNPEFSSDGQRIVTTSIFPELTAWIWDSNGRKLASLQGHSIPPGAQNSWFNARFSPNSQQILTAASDNTTRIWNLSSKASSIILQHPGQIRSAQFSFDSQRIVTTSQLSLTANGTTTNELAQVWNLNGRELAVLESGEGNSFADRTNSDGQHILTISADNTIRVWNLNGEELSIIHHQDRVTSAQFSSNGQYVVIVTEPMRNSNGSVESSTITIWDLNSKQRTILRISEDNIRSVQFNPNTQRIITKQGYLDAVPELWDLNGRKLAVLLGDQQNPETVEAQFSSNGQRIVTRSAYDEIRIWDSDGEELTVLSQRGNITEFSPRSQYILTASGNTARIWNLNGKEIAILQGHQSEILSAQFSFDGQQIVTASADKTARIWDLSGRELAVLEGHQDSVRSAQFSPDGRWVITASDDKTARIWQVETLDQLLVRGCNWLQAYLPHVQNVLESDRQLCNTPISSSEQ